MTVTAECVTSRLFPSSCARVPSEEPRQSTSSHKGKPFTLIVCSSHSETEDKDSGADVLYVVTALRHGQMTMRPVSQEDMGRESALFITSKKKKADPEINTEAILISLAAAAEHLEEIV